ncbi:MAG: 2-amino-4-hydroxy-6-hydroxymethyldihydropteridine diphosphokinase, partial [Spirochaetes bacterium]
IPHPGIEKRLFVLIPLNDLIPDYIHPVLKKTCKALEEELRNIDNSAVAPSGLFL